MNSCEYWNGKAVDRCKIVGNEAHIFCNLKKAKIITDLLLGYIKKGDRILELGGGGCVVAQGVIGKIGFTPYVNYDISDEFVKFVHKSIGLPSLLRESEDSLFPFSTDGFDAVWMFDVLEHIAPHHRETTVDEIDRVLHSNGAIFINNPTYQSKHNQEFEWLVDDQDILNVFKNWRIHQKITYRCDESIIEFYVLTRKEPKTCQ